MGNLELWIGLGLIAVIALAATANLALRRFSRSDLADRLKLDESSPRLDRLVHHRDEYLFATAALRISGIIAFALLITHIYISEPFNVPVHTYVVTFFVAGFMILIVGVMLPSAWARYGSNGFLAMSLPMLAALRYTMWPLLGLHRGADVLIRRLAGVPKTDDKQAEADQIEKEILDALSEGELAGTVHEEDAEMIESIMSFRETDVAEIMTPRTDIIALPATVTLPEAKSLITREGHSRIPIYGENIDDIKGVLYAKDLLACTDASAFNPLKVMRKVPFVPETKQISELLAELRKQRVHLAIVVDEYGGTAGLVTVEDIIEEIFGEIADEYETPEPEPIRRIDERTLDVDAWVHIEELNEELKLELPEERDYDTVGGFLFSEMGKIPAVGEELRIQHVRFRVLDAEDRRVNRLRVEILSPQPTNPSDPA